MERLALTRRQAPAGALQPGPTKLDLRRSSDQRSRAHSRGRSLRAQPAHSGRKAVRRRGRREKETLTLDLGGKRGRGEIVVVSSHGVVRAAYPTSPWASRVEVRPDGTMRVVSGTALNIERRTTKPANAAPAVPTRRRSTLVSSNRLAMSDSVREVEVGGGVNDRRIRTRREDRGTVRERTTSSFPDGKAPASAAERRTTMRTSQSAVNGRGSLRAAVFFLCHRPLARQ